MANHFPFFLRDKATLDALEALSAADDLVLYCGAGVSIDRTGLSWSALLRDVYKEAATHDRANRQREHRAIEFLLDHLSEVEQQASVLTEYFTEHDPETSTAWLTSILQRILYVDNGWSEGSLLNNLVNLALVARPRLSSVTILTTNYDVYLEEEFASVAKEIAARSEEAGIEWATPGLERLVSPSLPSDEEWPAVEIIPPSGTDTKVRLVYLHGRVPRAGSPVEGTVVLDEYSYAQSHEAVTRQLKTYLSAGHVLSVGASVTDSPLIEALVLTKDKASTSRRFALVHPTVQMKTARPTSGKPFDPAYSDATGRPQTLKQSEIDDMLTNRGSQLGIAQLHPISHSQTAQFVEELDLSIRLHRSESGRRYRDASTGINYEQRLARWNAEWPATGADPQTAYEVLDHALTGDLSVILGGTASENEGLRLETWIRIDPSSENRAVTLYANSAGPLLNPHVRRKEPIEAESANASVKCFLEGRPLLRSQPSGEPSRWRVFFSVPLTEQVLTLVDDVPYAASVPVGVMTLAGLETARLGDRIDRLTLDDIERLKGAMVAAGSKVLRPSTSQQETEPVEP